MKRWPWILYGIFLTNIVLSYFFDLISKDSVLHTYYTILIAFNKWYYVVFVLNVMSILINLVTPVIAFLYAFETKTPHHKIWKILFFVRIGLDLTGHYYDLQFMKSAFYRSMPFGFAAIGVFIIPLIPSYLVHYLYAFKRPKSLS